MNFPDAVKTCFQKYVTFSGRASRSEYWYWALFNALVSIVLQVADKSGMLANIFALATLLPYIAVTCRRLHDVDRSGWWQLLVFIPVIGWIVLLIWYVTKGTDGDNRFGSDPLSGVLV